MSGMCDTMVTVAALAVSGLVMLALGYALACAVKRWCAGRVTGPPAETRP